MKLQDLKRKSFFEIEELPTMITIEKVDPEFPNAFHVDLLNGLQIGSLLLHKEEIVRVRGISTMWEKLLFLDRGFANSPLSEIGARDQLIVIGCDNAKDLYPLTVITRIGNGE